jgi:hypothetical protein
LRVVASRTRSASAPTGSYSCAGRRADASRRDIHVAASDEGEDAMRRRVWIVSVSVLAFMGVFLPVADAYVDPGAGSFIFQAVIGGVLAAGVAVKVFWKRLSTIVSRRDRDADPEP